jgi:D-aminopeptidase
MTSLRDLGLAIGSLETGPLNAITDVEGVRVGHTTIIDGDGPLVVGNGPVRTGVTVILPRATSAREQPLFAGAFTLNGNGEFTGLEWIRESGLLTTPIGLTNTHSVGVVRDALVAYESREREAAGRYWSMPAVAETYDGWLNDIDGQHVTAAHVIAALGSASTGTVAEGNVGGGTGMVCHGFKGGIGTSSRRLSAKDGAWTVGVLVQANYGRREELRVAGVPVGEMIPVSEVPDLPSVDRAGRPSLPPGAGSIVVIIATDAPLLPEQCRRLATRAGVGLSRVGGGASDASGDLMLAFSTANTEIPAEYYWADTPLTYELRAVAHQRTAPLLQAAADATEEAIVSALLAAETMVGRDGFTAYGLDPDRLVAAMRSAEEPRG